jgi:hypothetical protein
VTVFFEWRKVPNVDRCISLVFRGKFPSCGKVTQISTMYHCNTSYNYHKKYDQFLPIDSEHRFSKF